MSNNQSITCPTVPVSALLIKHFTPGKVGETSEVTNTNIESSNNHTDPESSSFYEKSDVIQTVPFSSRMLRPLTVISEQKPANSSPGIGHFVSSELFGPSSTMEVAALVSDYQKCSQENRPIRRRPDSFISLRITSATLLSKLSSIQTELVESDPSTAAALTPPQTFHITLLAMYTGDASENVGSAKHILKQCVEQFRVDHKGILSLKFQGLGHFSNKVFFASTVNDESLESLTLFAKTLTNKFKSNYKYRSDESSEFRAHLTLAKTSKIRKRSRRDRNQGFKPDLIRALISKYSKCALGEERVESVELLSMNKKKDSDGYYHCYDKFSLINY